MIFLTAYLGGTHGTAKSARDFLRAMLSSGSIIKVISPTQESFPSELCNKRLSTPLWYKVPVPVYLPSRMWKLRPHNIFSWLNYQYLKFRIYTIPKNETVIVNGWASYSTWVKIEKRFTGKKVLIIRESPRHFSTVDRDMPIEKLLAGFASFDDLIFVSNNIRKEWMKFPELSKKRSFFVPNCCEEEDVKISLSQDRNVIREKMGLSKNEFIIICPGTIEYRKGQDLLIEIIPNLVSVIPNLRILFIGDTVTNWGSDLMSKLKSGKHKDYVTHFQSTSLILDLIVASDILAFPSRAEAMPRTILEAMALKIPIVASNIDGIPELIINNKTGILFTSNDANELMNGLIRIAKDTNIGKEFALKGYTRYWKKFSRKNQFNNVQKVMRKIEK